MLHPNAIINRGYRGEIGVILANFGREGFVVTRGLRVAQLVVAAVARILWRETAALPDSQRGAGGFGSTGR